MASRKSKKPVIEDDDEASDEADESLDDEDDDSDDDDEDDDDDAESESERDDSDDDAEDDDEEPELDAAARRRRRRRGETVPSGMGRRSTGPARRPPSAPPMVTLDEEGGATLEPDISSWPGTAEAARQVGKHPSTIKLWRTQRRIRAIQDDSGCWKHHPDDLAEAINIPDQTDPGTVLASGMSAIVQQGEKANDRLIAMTELSVDGLKETILLLREELRRVYARNEQLEKHISELRDKHAATHADDLKHERFMKKLDLKHEIDMNGAQETSVRLQGLLSILGPIAASIGARVLGLNAQADKIDQAVAGGGAQPAGAPTTPAGSDAAPSPVESSRLMPFETQITVAMGKLCDAIRMLDKPAFAGLRAMLPQPVADALDAVVRNENDQVVGRALAIIVQAAQNLSDLQFKALRPIAPQTIAAILTELREIVRNQESTEARPS